LLLSALANGRYPLGYVDIDLYHLLRFNDYEGFRPGLGLMTSDRLSRWVSLGGYGGYGFKDKAWKYGGDLKINFNRLKTTFIDIEAAREVKETAGTQFLTPGNPLFDPSAYRDLMISKMDKVDFGRISFNTGIYRFIKLSAFFDVRQQASPFGYMASDAIVPATEQHTFNFNTTGLQLRIWPGEKFTESMGRLMSSGSKWPVFYVNLTKGLNTTIGQYSGQFDFTKIDLRIEQKLPFKIKGYLWYELQAGKVFGNVPYSLQYNNKGSRASAYALSVENTMETMYLNEFTSTQYAAVFLSLNSGQFLKPYRYSRPEIELVHNYIIGNISNPSQLASNVPLKDLSKGYTEAGIRLRNILVYNFSGFGAGFFYRYGNYASPKSTNNLVIKLVFNFVL